MYLFFRCKKALKLLFFILPFTVAAETNIRAVDLVQEVELKPTTTPNIQVEPTVLKPTTTPNIQVEPTELKPTTTPNIQVEPTELKPTTTPNIAIERPELTSISLLPVLGIDETALEPIFVPTSEGGQAELKPIIFPILDIENAKLDPILLPLLDLGTGKIEYEPNNIFGDARPIIPGFTPQAHKFDYAGDEDWLSFQAKKDDYFGIAVVPDNAAQGINLAFELYNETGEVEVSSVDLNVAGDGEYANWQAPANGVYYIRVINNESLFNIDAHFQVGVAVYTSLSAVVIGKVIDSCTESGMKAAIDGSGLSATSDEYGDFSANLIPDSTTNDNYSITARANGYTEKSKLIRVEELYATPVGFDLLPETGCPASEPTAPMAETPTTETPTAETPTANEDSIQSEMELLKQQAVANYDDSNRILVVKDVRVGNDILAVSLRAQDDFSFILTTVTHLSEGVSNRPAFYNYDSLLADLPDVFAFGQLFKVKLRRLGAEGAFVVQKADPIK